MNWKDAIKHSPERTALLRKGDFCYLKYPNGSVFIADYSRFKIVEKYHGSIDGEWEPLGLHFGNLDNVD